METLSIDIFPQTDLKKSGNRPYVIAGPCSAESQEQVLATARALDQMTDVQVFRAGVWKPRTRPNTFEGVGAPALKWLQQVQQETRLAVAVEVANAAHVELALEHGMDVLWVGARTTVNPFSVQDVADALKGVDIPVWVKNPVNPDLQLWIGALERISKAGIRRLGAIHRGFTSEQKSAYRNAPKWQVAVELKRLLPEIPVICDPSHIAGDGGLVRELAQKAMDLAMSGLMIEVHPDPARAMSDAKQQIVPSDLEQLLAGLKIRKENGRGYSADDELGRLRQRSNAIDYELLETLARRMDVVRDIGRYKKRNNLTILQVKRWDEVLQDRLEKAGEIGLDRHLVETIYQLLHSHAIKLQSEVMNEED